MNSRNPNTAVHIAMGPDMAAQTAGDLKVQTGVVIIARVGCLGIRAKTVVLSAATRGMVAGVRMTNRETRMLIPMIMIKNDTIGLLTKS